MSLTIKDLDHVLDLSYLQISDEEKKEYLTQLQHILQHMKNLSTADLSDIPPTSHTTSSPTILRKDTIKNNDGLLLDKNAPRFENNCFHVPRILEDT